MAFFQEVFHGGGGGQNLLLCRFSDCFANVRLLFEQNLGEEGQTALGGCHPCGRKAVSGHVRKLFLLDDGLRDPPVIESEVKLFMLICVNEN